jgi:hypothetical protein
MASIISDPVGLQNSVVAFSWFFVTSSLKGAVGNSMPSLDFLPWYLFQKVSTVTTHCLQLLMCLLPSFTNFSPFKDRGYLYLGLVAVAFLESAAPLQPRRGVINPFFLRVYVLFFYKGRARAAL